jgi:hypothetical protein
MSLEEPPIDRQHGLRRLGKSRLIEIVAAVLVILALVAEGTTYALFGLAAATVTITPASRDVSKIYTLSAVTGTPDASRQQVEARLVSATTPAQTKTAKASGHLSAAAAQARGRLVLHNWDTAPKIFEAGTVLPDWSADLVVNCGDSPSAIVLDATVTVPAAVGTAAGYGVAYAPGHVLEPGAAGNIPATTGYNSCVYFLWAQGKCVPGFYRHCWTIAPASNFSGGQDAYNGPIVQQSDIDTTANSLISANQPDPQQVLQRQMRPGERLVDVPQCTPHASANHQAGDRTAQVTVSVSFTCAGEVYDQQAVFALATRLLTVHAAPAPGTGYALVGKVKTAVINATSAGQGSVTLTVFAEGVWAYQFTDAQKQHLAALLTGKSEPEGIRLAAGQPGVAHVTIQLAASQQTLPTNPRQITIVVQAVPGA